MAPAVWKFNVTFCIYNIDSILFQPLRRTDNTMQRNADILRSAWEENMLRSSETIYQWKKYIMVKKNYFLLLI